MPLKEPPPGVKAKFIFGNSIRESEVGPLIWQEYLPVALEQGKYVAVLAPEIVGHGLESVQLALDLGENPAKKAVVTL